MSADAVPHAPAGGAVVTIYAADLRLLMECAGAARHLTDPVVAPLNEALRRCDDALA